MIRLSTAAANEVRRLRRRHRISERGVLHIGIQERGCAGLSYHLDFSETPQLEDQVFECDGLQVAVAPAQLPYLDGLVLDYAEDLMGGSFRFDNPNAKKSCSCGHSFAVEESTEA
ncbi:MAG TPA: iron-sulfur cluster assembly accessory protein [Stenomitos sp.]